MYVQRCAVMSDCAQASVSSSTSSLRPPTTSVPGTERFPLDDARAGAEAFAADAVDVAQHVGRMAGAQAVDAADVGALRPRLEFGGFFGAAGGAVADERARQLGAHHVGEVPGGREADAVEGRLVDDLVDLDDVLQAVVAQELADRADVDLDATEVAEQLQVAARPVGFEPEALQDPGEVPQQGVVVGGGGHLIAIAGGERDRAHFAPAPIAVPADGIEEANGGVGLRDGDELRGGAGRVAGVGAKTPRRSDRRCSCGRRSRPAG